MQIQIDDNGPAEAAVYQRLGIITRQLHDALKELGHTERLTGTVEQLPDTQSRLSYIVRLTGEAAEKVLSEVEGAKEEQAKIAQRGHQLVAALEADPALSAAVPELLSWSKEMVQTSADTDRRLTEIMLAQDFHDLTGQVIGRVAQLATTIESQLLDLLLQSAPSGKPGADQASAPALALNGPLVNGGQCSNVVKNQQQVDELLASLGF